MDRHINIQAFKNKTATYVLAIFAIIIVFVFNFGLPSIAYADKNTELLDKLDEEMIAAQIEVDKQQKEYDATKEAISQLAVTLYKITDGGHFLESIADLQSLPEVIDQISYINKIYQQLDTKLSESAIISQHLKEAQIASDAAKELRFIKAKEMIDASKIHYSQNDPRWTNESYWTATIGWAGCGLCAYTSIVDILTGQELNPLDMLYLRGDWAGMDHFLDDRTGTPNGETHSQFSLKQFGLTTSIVNTSEMLEKISEPNCAAMVLYAGGLKQNGGGWWYTDGHYVCAYDYKDGVLHIQDPAGGVGVGQDVQYYGSDLDVFLNGIICIVLYESN